MDATATGVFDMWQRIIPCLLAALVGCTHAPPLHGAAPPAAAQHVQAPAAPSCELGTEQNSLPNVSHAELLSELGSDLDAYRTTGGVWLADQPLLLNEPFDFAVALGIASIGPGIAAGKRLQANREKAQALATLRLPPRLIERLDRLRVCGVHAYAVLWGPSSEELLLSVDVFARKEEGVLHRVAHGESAQPIAPLATQPSPDGASTLKRSFTQALDTALAATRE